METYNYSNRVKRCLESLGNNPSSKEQILQELGKLNEAKLTNTIIKTIYEDLKQFSYENEDDLTYLTSAIEVLDILGMVEKLKLDVVGFFENLHNDLVKLISISKGKDDNYQYQLLVKALNKLEKETKNYTIKENNSDSKNGEAIISYAIFDLKDFASFDNMLQKDNNLVNMVDKNGCPLIKKIIWRYLIAINRFIEDNNRIEIQYYYRLFNRIITDKNFRISDEEKRVYNKIIDSYLKKYDKLTDNKKEEIAYYINKIILGLLGSSTEDTSIETLNYEYGISKDFSVPINTEVSKIRLMNRNITPSNNTRRIYTFDHNPNEIDDGISVTREDGLLVAGIHIANPTMYIPDKSIIFNEARNRTESIYFDNGDKPPICIPMLPPLLSEELMGLNKGKDVYSINYYYYYDERTGNLVNREVKEDTIRIYKNYDYEDYDALIKHGTDEDVIRDLEDMEKLAGFMARDYDQTMIRGLMGTKSKASRGINVVTNFMIGNNINMARWANELDVPFIYRNHVLAEGKDKVDNIKKKVLSRKPVTSIFKLLEILDNICPNAKYSSMCIGHDTLGTKYYSHTTSPLRRFVDIINILCIKKFIINRDYTDEDIRIYREYICKVIEEVNSKRKFIASYSKEYEKRLALIR